MDRVEDWRLRKCSDVEREYAYYELLHDDVVVMEIAATDRGEIEVLFETGAPGRLFALPELKRVFQKAEELLRADIGSNP